MTLAPTAPKSFYFSTRDLLIMAVLAAMGGVASTYINAVGNAVHAALGFPGATQWAAGLHTIWIVLAMGILRKTGAGTTMGLLKGAVELMSGNTHGVIILLINLVAGLLVDFGFLIFRNNRTIAPYIVAGALSAGSNVIIFQLFATLPASILAMSAILLLTVVASISGVIFSGFLPYFLVNTLIKANVVRQSENTSQNSRYGWSILIGVSILAILLTVYLRSTLRGSPTIHISGAVDNSFEFPSQTFSPELVSRQMPYRGIQTEYTGYPLSELITYAQPADGADTLLIEASDGYAFLISLEELHTNPNILVVPQGQEQNQSFDVVGPASSKAWVRNVTAITISSSPGLPITTASGEINSFIPDDWVDDMDSTQVALPIGSQKLQGVPLWKVIEPLIVAENQAVIQVKSDQDTLTFSWQTINGDDNLRIFTVIDNDRFKFALGAMSGDVYLFPLTGIEVE